jgi:hypothetical protein
MEKEIGVYAASLLISFSTSPLESRSDFVIVAVAFKPRTWRASVVCRGATLEIPENFTRRSGTPGGGALCRGINPTGYRHGIAPR